MEILTEYTMVDTLRFLSLTLLMATSTVQAQNCPPGIPAAGNPACIPPDRENSPYYQGGPASVHEKWEARWGAVATNSATGQVGTAVGFPGEGMAKDVALERCGSGCRIHMTYKNQCAAMAWGSGRSSINSAATIEEAKLRALRVCGKGASDCRVVFAECSLPKLVE